MVVAFIPPPSAIARSADGERSCTDAEEAEGWIDSPMAIPFQVDMPLKDKHTTVLFTHETKRNQRIRISQMSGCVGMLSSVQAPHIIGILPA